MAVTDSVGSVMTRMRISPAIARARMSVSVPRLALSRDDTPGCAMRSASLVRLAPREHEWSRRIEARRETLLADGATTGPAFDP